MIKKRYCILILIILIGSISGCTASDDDYSGTFIGYSWKGENKGVTLEDATQKIQTILTLDEDGVITDAQMVFWKLIDKHWVSRQGGDATVSVDFSIEPTPTTPGEDYTKGQSMFTVQTVDLMAFFAVAVDDDGTVAVLILEPTTRHQIEMKLEPGYDYTKTVADLTIDNGGLVPTVRASSHGLVQVEDWSDFDGKDIFHFNPFARVLTARGTFEGLDSTSTIKELLEHMGVTFVNNQPEPASEMHGFHSTGGWAGNYNSIQNYLVGKNAVDMTSLVDWSTEKWINAVNDDNFFGVDVQSGATKTAQNSLDTIAGATVRMSRESTSYQRALVAAGIIKESEVIKGRF